MNWWKNLKGKVNLKEPLKKHTTFRIGGKAKFFIEPKDNEDLKLLLKLVKRYRMPLWVIGSGSNILINDNGLAGVVLRLSSHFFKKVFFKNNSVTTGSGTQLSRLVWLAQKKGLSGAEILAGIPATIGGALAMNAGVKGKNIGALVKNVTVMDYHGRVKILKKKDLKFSYRDSHLSKYIILAATLKLVKKNKDKISAAIKHYLDYRKSTQDYSFPSAGCVFKNPPGDSAGRIIDLCGLKGKGIGGARVSRIHANFILNHGNAKAAEVLRLMRSLSREAKERFNLIFKPEIKKWR